MSERFLYTARELEEVIAKARVSKMHLQQNIDELHRARRNITTGYRIAWLTLGVALVLQVVFYLWARNICSANLLEVAVG